MKFLTLILGISTLAICKDAAHHEDSRLEQIKTRAKHAHRDLDENKDGHVSLNQISTGIKKGLGLVPDQTGASEPSYTQIFYEKFISGKKDKSNYLTQDDFEELFSSFARSKGRDNQSDSEQDNDQSSWLELLKQKANKLYDGFDQNKDGGVSLEELTKGFKSGLGFEDDEEEQGDHKKALKNKKDENSLKQQAEKLYQKYIKKSGKKQGISRENFYEIIQQKRQDSFLQKAKEKASDLYKSLTENKVKYGSLQQFSKGVKQYLKIQDSSDQKYQKSISEKLGELYQKYVKSGKDGLSLDDLQTVVSGHMKKTKKCASKKAKKIKQSVEDAIDQASDQASQAKDKAAKTAKKAKQNIDKTVKTVGQKASEAKQKIKGGAEKVADEVADSAAKLKKKASKTIQGAKDTLQDAAQVISDKASQLKDSGSQILENIAQKAGDIKDSISQKAGDIKDSISQKLSDGAQKLSQGAKDAYDSLKQSGQETYEQIKQKASQLYSKIGDNNISFEDLKQKIKSGLGINDDEDKQEDKSFTERLQSAYNKYVKQQKGKERLSKEDFLSIFASQNKIRNKKSFLKRTQQQANKLYQSFDKNKDGHVSLEQVEAGIKQGLGFGQGQVESKDQNSVKSYLNSLYEKYIKPNEKKQNYFTKEDFCDMVRQRQKQRKHKKHYCKSVGLLNLEELKAKACEIHEQFDTNKDGRVTIEEAAQGIKDKINIFGDDEKDEKSLFQYAKGLYDKYIGSGSKKQIELSKDDFTKMIYEWKDQCKAKHAEQL